MKDEKFVDAKWRHEQSIFLYALVKTSCVKINLKKIPHMRFVYITVYCQGRAAITIYSTNRNHAFLLSLITCPDYAYSQQRRF